MPVGGLIAGGIGAVGSIGSALIGSSASEKASQQQVMMQQQALQQQKDMFGVAQGALNPFIQGGQSVLPTLQKLITPGADQSATLSQTPGFQFASQYGTKAATNALAARGQGASAGPLATAVSQFNNGLAQNTWQNTVNALQGYAGLGANAAGSLAGGAINSGNAQAGTLTNTGNALASGTLGSANAVMGGINGVANAGTNALLYNKLFGGGGGNGIYDSPANAGTSMAVSNGGYNFLDAAAG